MEVAAAIKKCYPNCEVVFNKVPKAWAMSDIYCQLIPNDDQKDPYYEIVPRIGSFEVSFNGIVSKLLLFDTICNSYFFRNACLVIGQTTQWLERNVPRLLN